MAVARLRQNRFLSTELTEREKDVLRCAAEGLHRKETAKKLFLADATISRHRRNIFVKLNAKTLAHAVALAYRKGLLKLEV